MALVSIGSPTPGAQQKGRTYFPQARAVLQIVFEGFGPTALDSDPLVIPVLPKSLTIHRNTYRQADSWDITFDAADFPIDPQLVRAGAIEIFLFQLEGISDDQRLLDRQLTTVGSAAQENPLGDLKNQSVQRAQQRKEFEAEITRFLFSQNPQIAGLFDDHQITLSDNGREVRISGQDYTQLLIAKKWPPTPRGRARKIPVGRRVDLILSEILAEADGTGRLKIKVREIETNKLPIVQSPIVRGKKRGIPVQAETSYWDVMYKLATRHGLILFVDGLEVILTRPQNLTDKDVHRVRKLTWGENIEQVTVSRRMGKEKVPRILVRGYDQEGKEVVEVTFPPGLPRPKQKQTSKKGDTVQKFKSRKKKRRKGKRTITQNVDDEYEIVPIRGITDPAILRETAEMLYNLRGKGEHKINVQTRDLKVFNLIGNTPDDILNVTAGDAIWIQWDPFNRELLASTKLNQQEKVQYLVNRGYGRSIAETIVKSYEKLEAFRRPLRVREITFEYAQDTGIAIEMELIDFIVIGGERKDKKESINQEQGIEATVSELPNVVAQGALPPRDPSSPLPGLLE